MSNEQAIFGPTMMRRALAAVLATSALLSGGRARADILKKDDLLRGITMTRAQCDAVQQTLWLNVSGREFCVRYYLSTAGGEGSRPVIFLNGDSNGPVDVTQDGAGRVTLTWHDPSRARDENTDDLAGMADVFSKMAKTTAIYVARIGDNGTSGSHLSRKTLLELQLMNATLDALKQRYRFEGFNLVGESGGGRIAFGLGGMRGDIGCLVSSSGQLTSPLPFSQRSDPGKTFEINVPALAQRHAMRQLIVSDPQDQQVPAATEQTPMVTKLRQAGGAVTQFFVKSTDDNHHGVVEYAEIVIAGCVLGKRDADISEAIQTIVRRNTETIQRKQEEAKANASAAPAPRQPPVAPRVTPPTSIRRPTGGPG